MKILQKRNFRRSYSQQGEDLLIDFIFNRYNAECRFYVDIGSNHPQQLSNSYYFSRKGGRGVCVDPNKAFEKLYKRLRPNDVFVPGGVTGGHTSKLPYYMMDWHQFNTFDQNVAQATEIKYEGRNKIRNVVELPVININEFLEKYTSQEIDLLNLDVEGMDEEILRSWNFSKYRPWVVCVESQGSLDLALRSEAYQILSAQGYVLHGFNHVNIILTLFS